MYIVFNFILFLHTGLGQLLIYCSIHTSTMCILSSISSSSCTPVWGSDSSSALFTLAQCVYPIACLRKKQKSDHCSLHYFLCWCPVSFLGQLVSQVMAVTHEAQSLPSLSPPSHYLNHRSCFGYAVIFFLN